MVGEAIPALDAVPDGTLERVAAFCNRERLLNRTHRVLLAVSGGADSLAALLILCRLRERFGFEVVTCHFDHQLRSESDSERDWVRNICESIGVPCVTGEGDVAGLARESRLSLETAARQMRYEFLAFAAGQKTADCVATGHTADDQTETVLMHILRGTGIRGLRGILPASTVPGAGAMRLIRPILALTAEETKSICTVAGLTPIEDPSNSDITLQRNRVRNETLPALRAVNPSVDVALRNLAANARGSFAAIERQAHGIVAKARGPFGAVYSADEFSELDTEARVIVIERELASAGLDMEVNRTRVLNLGQALGSGRGRVAFGEGEVEVSTRLVRIGPPQPPEETESAILNVPGTTLAAAWRVQVHASDPGPVPEGLVRVPVAPEGVLRARRLSPGDRILLGTTWRKAKDLYSSRRIPTWERRAAIAIADSRGVLAVAGPGGWDCGGQPEEPDRLYVDFHGPDAKTK